jgi:predicted Zn-dependent protease
MPATALRLQDATMQIATLIEVSMQQKEYQPMPTPDEAYAAAEKLKDGGKLEEAVAALEEVIAGHPDFALAHSAISAWCTRLERHEKAVEHARRVCELEPNEPFSFTALSVACMKACKIPEAEDALARARMMQG